MRFIFMLIKTRQIPLDSGNQRKLSCGWGKFLYKVVIKFLTISRTALDILGTFFIAEEKLIRQIRNIKWFNRNIKKKFLIIVYFEDKYRNLSIFLLFFSKLHNRKWLSFEQVWGLEHMFTNKVLYYRFTIKYLLHSWIFSTIALCTIFHQQTNLRFIITYLVKFVINPKGHLTIT